MSTEEESKEQPEDVTPTYVEVQGDHIPNPTATVRFSSEEETQEHAYELPQSFVVGDLLGLGGMGQVHRASQTSLARDVALKCLREGLPPQAASALVREALITGRLEHPNVVPIHDIATDEDGQPMLVMKVVEGQEWGKLVEDPGLLPSSARPDPFAFHIDVLIQVADCLRFAHSKHILHRDLKPENLMIGAFGEVYVLDWGIGILLVADPHGLLPDRTTHAGIVGTPIYMAPEMFERGGERLSPATDVYLLGGLLHHLLVGGPQRKPSHDLRELRAFAYEPVTVPPEVPADLRTLLAGMLGLAPEERPSLVDVQEALRQHLRQRHANRLYDAAMETMEQLDVALAITEAPPTADIHRLYGATRFGFEAALRQAPSHVESRQSRHALTERMVRHELAQGSPDFARSFLAQLPDAPPELQAEVEDHVDRLRAEEDRLHRLDVLHDSRTGLLLRFCCFVAYGLFVLMFPVLDGLFGFERGLAWELVRSGTLCGLLGLVSMLVGPWLRRSAITSGYIRLGFASPMLRSLAAVVLIHRMELPTFMLITALLDTTLLLVASMVLDRRIAPLALIYATTVLVAGSLEGPMVEAALGVGTVAFVLVGMASMVLIAVLDRR